MLLIIDGAGHVLVFPPLNFAKSAPLRSNVCSIGRYRFGLPASTLRCDQPPSPARVVIERRPSITVTSSPRLLYLLAIGLSCVTVLACGVGPCSAVRKPPSLAEWPSEGKSPCFLAWRGAGCGAEFLDPSASRLVSSLSLARHSRSTTVTPCPCSLPRPLHACRNLPLAKISQHSRCPLCSAERTALSQSPIAVSKRRPRQNPTHAMTTPRPTSPPHTRPCATR